MKTKKISLEPKKSWPQKGMQLFSSAPDVCNDALVNRGEKTLRLYADCYKEAADTLIEQVTETGLMHNILVLPIVFMYRHHLELMLKDIIEGAYYLSLTDFRPPVARQKFWETWKRRATGRIEKNGLSYPSEKDGHNLENLWNCEIRKIIEAAAAEVSRTELEVVQNCLHEFQVVDPRGDGFRYPTTRQGKKTLETLSRINLRQLKETVDGLGFFLMCISDEIERRREFEEEGYR